MVLPAENGTIARIGRAVGQAACANAGRTSTGAARTPAEILRNVRRLCFFMRFPQLTCATSFYFGEALSTGLVTVISLIFGLVCDFFRTVIVPSLRCSPLTV